MNAPTVFVMDDNPDVRCVLHQCLQDRGFSVVTISDGESGLDLALREQPDLMIVDMMMPRKSGFLVLKELRQQIPAHIPFIMISANGDARQQAYARALGADAFLSKPFQLRQLIRQVEDLCPLGKQHESPDAAASLTGSIH